MITMNTAAVGVIIAGARNSCYITSWGWCLVDMGPRFRSHL